MKALMLQAYNQFVYTDVPEPDIGTDDALIQVKACGICGSDVHGMDGSSGRRIPPIIMGHEASGIIAGVVRNEQQVVEIGSGQAKGERIDRCIELQHQLRVVVLVEANDCATLGPESSPQTSIGRESQVANAELAVRGELGRLRIKDRDAVACRDVDPTAFGIDRQRLCNSITIFAEYQTGIGIELQQWATAGGCP